MLRKLMLRSIALGMLTALYVIPASAQDEVVDSIPPLPEYDDDLPLDVDRVVRYTTEEGSWISLDVSPDGSTIVFDLLGDLYTMPFAGGEATRITSGMALDGQPRFSPDGTHIVYTSDRNGGENIWIMELATGEATRVTKGKSNRYQSPEWTPDGNYLIASKAGLRSGRPQLWIFHKDGGSGRELIEDAPDNLKQLGAAFGPEGRYVWFAQRTGNWQYNAIYPQYQLAYYDRDTGNRYTRTSRFGSGLRPTLSPDGHWLVYGTRHDAQTGLVRRDLTTGEETWLAYPVQHDDQESRATRDVLPGMSFTPDSREVVMSYGGKIWRVPIDGGDAIQIPFSAEVELALGPRVNFDYPIEDTPQFEARQIRDAVPSPDGDRIAFAAMDRLYVMDFPDGEPRRLTRNDFVEAQPTWSPDGDWIAFATWSETAGGHVYKMRSNGRGRSERLTNQPGIYQQLAWSPDGERIVMIRGDARAFRDATGPRAFGASDDIVWISSDEDDGGTVHVVAPTDGRRAPHFSSSSERIFMTAGSRGLVSLRWDGTDEKEHIKVTGVKPPGSNNAPNASVILISPDERRAVAQVNNDIYVVTVPYVGGETPTISVARPENAAFPAWKLTDIGGQFPAWNPDGNRVHWSIGNAHFVYDMARAEIVSDSLEAAEAAEDEDEAADDGENGAEDQAADEGDEAEDEDEEDTGYQPLEFRVHIMVDRDIPEGVIALTGARIITMNGDEIIENGTVVVRNNRIEAVGGAGAVSVPADAETVDLSGTTIVPGFVDVHAHMRPAWGIHKNYAWTYLANLAYGVTTTRDPQTGTTDVLTYADLVESGDMIGPRIYSTGPGVFWSEQVRDLDHAQNILRRYSEYYDTKTIKMYVAGNREQRQWIIQAAREQQLMPTTEGSLNLKLNITEMIDGYPGHEHSFPIFPLYSDIIRLGVETMFTYTPTLLVAYGGPWAENYFYETENVHDNAKVRRFIPHSVVDR
ncbi:MAG: amidohydrolase, partial [Gemmatimonadales bacterium]